MRRAIPILALLAAPLLSGCEDPPPAGSTGAPPTGALSDGDLPVPADYEDEADTTIGAENYKAEIDKLEKEIEAAN